MEPKKIPLENVMKYLRGKGWRIESWNGYMNRISIISEGETFDIFLPNKEELKDYDFRIQQLLGGLSSIERRDVPDIAREIMSWSVPDENLAKLMGMLLSIPTHTCEEATAIKRAVNLLYENALEKSIETAPDAKAIAEILKTHNLDDRFTHRQVFRLGFDAGKKMVIK
jgi:hypothetical protein